MVLSVLFCAGAVPLTDDYLSSAVPTAATSIQQQHQPQQFVLPSQFAPSQQQQQQPEYVQFLESLVGELSCVFANWVHTNPPLSPNSTAELVSDMYHHQRTSNTCRNRSSGAVSPLPDVIPHHLSSTGKWNCSTPTSSTGADLRVRRGMAPMRFRLDSVGSSVASPSSSTSTTPATSPLYSPLGFDLLPASPDSAASTSSFTFDDHLIPSSPSAHDSIDAPSSPSIGDSADWRRVGRDLRGIADHFASTRTSSREVQPSSSSHWISMLLGSPLASAGPLMSALAVYVWWKLVRRLAA